MTPQGRQRSCDLLNGDYLQVTSARIATNGCGLDEGFAHIERIEHVTEPAALAVLSHRDIPGSPVPVVWCHGLPGPLLLQDGDVNVLEHANPERVEHDSAHPWWSLADDILLAGSQIEGAKPIRGRRRSRELTGRIDWATASSQVRTRHRATAFAKPASALRVGDYLRLHAERWPSHDCDIDEGFARIEDVRILDPQTAASVFSDAAWRTTVIAVGLHGLSGILVLRGCDEVMVMSFVNPERRDSDQRGQRIGGPILELTGSRLLTDAEVRHADEVDAANRPRVDEASWYLSRYGSKWERRLALESVHGFRTVPLAALPWPHYQSECPRSLKEIVDAKRHGVPDDQAAHAAAFLAKDGERVRLLCRYHQPDWRRLVRILQETLDKAGDPVLDRKIHPEYGQLSAKDKESLDALIDDPIVWHDRDEELTNGQHRLCALRAAGIRACPIKGDFLPDTDYGSVQDASADAREAIIASWKRHASDRGWPTWCGRLASALPCSLRARLINPR